MLCLVAIDDEPAGQLLLLRLFWLDIIDLGHVKLVKALERGGL